MNINQRASDGAKMLVDEWVETVWIVLQVRPNTLHDYKRRNKWHLQPKLGNILIDETTSQLFQIKQIWLAKHRQLTLLHRFNQIVKGSSKIKEKKWNHLNPGNLVQPNQVKRLHLQNKKVRREKCTLKYHALYTLN